MRKTIDRREFLKLAGLLSLGYAIPQWIARPAVQQFSSRRQNVLIVLFDAFSASNISLYGYPRQTTPNIDRLAERAIVYHNHIASGNFTTPGTASLLTGTLPWTHRAFFLYDPIIKSLKEKNIFGVFADYHRLAYTHNPAADVFLTQFLAEIDQLTLWEDLYLSKNNIVNKWFRNDFDIASVSWERAFHREEDGEAYSLYLSHMYENLKRDFEEIRQNFPDGLPGASGSHFLLEDGIDQLQKSISAAPQPFLGYYHFFPPHDPYHTRTGFWGSFQNDHYLPIEKPPHIFKRDWSAEFILQKRAEYDEFILYVDSEFARLYNALEQDGLLDNTWLVLTSDHGEMFERLIDRHTTEVLYQPIVRIPLLIFPPGQESRVDVFENTSAIDLLPTLSHVTQHEIPAWAEGKVLPPFSISLADAKKDVFSSMVRETDARGHVTKATATILRDNFKLIYYYGYQELGEAGELIELYDLQADPEELNNLYPGENRIADELLGILKAKGEAGK